MNILATLSVTDLNEILKLRQETETLQARLAEIDAALAAFAEGKTPVATAVVPAATAASDAEPARPKQRRMSPAARARISAARKAWWAKKKGTGMVESAAKPGAAKGPKRGKHGAVKEAIIELLKNAGSEGITVKEIAAKLGGSYNRVLTWYCNTGKKIKEIKKVGPGKYGWAAASAPVAKLAATAKPEKPKAKGGKPGVAKETVIDLVKISGKAGITVKEIAGRLGVEAQRVYKWFNATGKKVKEIKKIAPAKYAWVG